MSRFSVYDKAYDDAEKAKRKVQELLEKGDFDGAEAELRTISSIADSFGTVAEDLDEYEVEWSNRIDDARVSTQSGQV